MEAFREINVKDEGIDGQDINYIMNIARTLPTIYRLSLENTPITDEDLDTLFSQLAKMDNIVILNLKRKSLRKEQVVKLVEMLQGRQTSLDVNLEANDLEDSGLDTLLEYVETAGVDNKLMSLKVGGNRITKVHRLAALLRKAGHSI